MVNMDNGKILGYIGDDKVKFSGVGFSNDRIKVMVRIFGGLRAVIEPPFMI